MRTLCFSEQFIKATSIINDIFPELTKDVRLGKLVKGKYLADSRNHSKINDPPPDWPMLALSFRLPLGPRALATGPPEWQAGDGGGAGSQGGAAQGGEGSRPRQHR